MGSREVMEGALSFLVQGMLQGFVSRERYRSSTLPMCCAR